MTFSVLSRARLACRKPVVTALVGLGVALAGAGACGAEKSFAEKRQFEVSLAEKSIELARADWRLEAWERQLNRFPRLAELLSENKDSATKFRQMSEELRLSAEAGLAVLDQWARCMEQAANPEELTPCGEAYQNSWRAGMRQDYETLANFVTAWYWLEFGKDIQEKQAHTQQKLEQQHQYELLRSYVATVKQTRTEFFSGELMMSALRELRDYVNDDANAFPPEDRKLGNALHRYYSEKYLAFRVAQREFNACWADVDTLDKMNGPCAKQYVATYERLFRAPAPAELTNVKFSEVGRQRLKQLLAKSPAGGLLLLLGINNS